MRKYMLAVVVGIILIFSGLAQAEETPRVFGLIESRLVAGTGYVDSGIQDIEKRAALLGGNFSLAVSAESPTGDADVRIEFLIFNPASGAWETSYYFYNPITDELKTYTGLVIDSTFTRFAREGSFFFFPVNIPVTGQFIVRVTGVNANPADTVVTVKLIRK